MKYLTKEELEDIAKQIIENPTRETLGKLNQKYNEVSNIETNNVSCEMAKMPSVELGPIKQAVVEPITNIQMEEHKNYNQPLEVVQTKTIINNQNSNQEMPNIELPIIDAPVFNNLPGENANNMNNVIDNSMQNVNNINLIPNSIPTTEVPITPAPFFITSAESIENQIPVTNMVNNSPVAEPTMFAQFEQNYM